MALMNCPDCGKPMSTAAPACPNCGRPNDSQAATGRVHGGGGEGCFLKTMNVGCALMFLFIGLVVVFVVMATDNP